MNTPKDRLLTEILVHESYATFRAQLLDKSLVEVRRRRWMHRGNQLLALAACLVIMGCLALVVLRTPGPGQAKFPGGTVRSVPLTSREVVNTTGLMATLVNTTPGGFARADIEVVRTRTQPSGPYFISDQQLLAFFAGRPIALVNHGAGNKQLWFLNPEDEAALMGN